MESLHINCPKGYEIDKNASDLSTGVIHFKEITDPYEDLSKTLFSDTPVFFIESNGDVVEAKSRMDPCAASNSKTAEQLEALLALNKLANVAKRLNGSWLPETRGEKHLIVAGYQQGERVLSVKPHMTMQTSSIYFRTGALAYAAIRILGEDAVYKALFLNQ